MRREKRVTLDSLPFLFSVSLWIWTRSPSYFSSAIIPLGMRFFISVIDSARWQSITLIGRPIIGFIALSLFLITASAMTPISGQTLYACSIVDLPLFPPLNAIASAFRIVISPTPMRNVPKAMRVMYLASTAVDLLRRFARISIFCDWLPLPDVSAIVPSVRYVTCFMLSFDDLKKSERINCIWLLELVCSNFWKSWARVRKCIGFGFS